MANTTPSTYMSMPVPTVGTDPGPDWATNLNACLTILDQHDHSSGNGAPINPSSLNINADLPFNGNNLTLVRSVRFQSQAAPINVATDLGCLYESGVDLYYNDGSGNQIRLTQSGAIVSGTPGSIANLVSPASASYVTADSTFVWQSNTSTPANLDAGFVILRNNVASSKGLTLSPPAAMGSNYTVTLPSLPAATNIMTLDTSGNMAAVLNVDNSSIERSSNTLRVKALGVTASMIALSTITGDQVASNINLPGATVQVNNLYPVVAASTSAGAMSMLRGLVGAAGNLSIGEGVSTTQPGTGIYTVTFTTPFSSAPVVVVSQSNQGGGAGAAAADVYVYGIDASKFNVSTQIGGVSASSQFTFIAIGPR